jgi:DNA-binding PadR family transcriptional regulator
VANGVLLVLAERSPLHGYELIAELEERSGGRWRPSPGSMYPTLGRLEEKGLIVGTTESGDEGDGKRFYELTDEGRDWIARRDPDAPTPWDEGETGSSGGLRPLVAEVVSATKQIGRFGDDEQRAAATEVLKKAKAELYRILAR